MGDGPAETRETQAQKNREEFSEGRAVIETAPGRVLTGLVRRIDRDVEGVNVDTAEALAALSGAGDA